MISAYTSQRQKVLINNLQFWNHVYGELFANILSNYHTPVSRDFGSEISPVILLVVVNLPYYTSIIE